MMNSNQILSRLFNYSQYVITLRFSSYQAAVSFEELTDLLKKNIEVKWKSKLNNGSFKPNDYSTKKKYVLSMFPYPSGNLHLGHIRVYTIGDTMARFYRLNGDNVFQPIGFDAFGLPAENAAFERKIPAKEWTYLNMKTMKKQLEGIGYSFDWNYEVATCDPCYYKFTQYIFLLMYKSGLVYQNEALVNWDPIDKTVLANEQVDEEGRSWRSGALVEKKILKQWFIQTTKFAYALSKSLDQPTLKNWRDIICLQKHWLGNCCGSSFKFPISRNGKIISSVNIWTRYPEFINGSTFLAIAPNSVINQMYGNSKVKLDIEIINPFNNQYLPVLVYENVNYDEGRDIKLINPSIDPVAKEFADKFSIPWYPSQECEEEIEERERICNFALNLGIGGYRVSSKLKDWPISRQRRWGTPIPLVHCHNCGIVPVSFKDLPVYLPEDDIEEWSKTLCPSCKSPAMKEKDTMDTFFDSAWYFLRYLDPNNEDLPYSKEIADRMMPIDLYIGGKEHATLHLYYARFFSHFLHSIGHLNEPEPFKNLLVQGMVMGKTYKVKESGRYVLHSNVTNSMGSLKDKTTGEHIEETWEKMSKSKYNGIEPDTILDKYGIDATRLFMLSEVAPTSHKYWKSDKFPGILNWQKRIWAFARDFSLSRTANNVEKVVDKEVEEMLWDSRNFYVKGISFNYKNSYQLSVAISKLQGFTNAMKKCPTKLLAHSPELEKCYSSFLIMMNPMAPHFTSELWSRLQKLPGCINITNQSILWDKPLIEQKWPTLDDNYNLKLIFSVNNAVKDYIHVPYHAFKHLTSEKASELAFSSEKVVSFIGSCDILGKDFNFVRDYEAYFNIEINHLQKYPDQVKKSNA